MTLIHALELAVATFAAGGILGFIFKSYLIGKAGAVLQKVSK